MSLVFHDALLAIDSLAGLVTYLTVQQRRRCYSPSVISSEHWIFVERPHTNSVAKVL